MKKFVLVRGDDWEGLYIDGELRYQHHEVPVENIIYHLGLDNFEFHNVDDDWLFEQGELPDKLHRVKLND